MTGTGILGLAAAGALLIYASWYGAARAGIPTVIVIAELFTGGLCLYTAAVLACGNT